MPIAISKDGTSIAYEKYGNGSTIIIVNGALAHRKSDGIKDIAAMLANSFSVIFYDRRGRGESTDTKPYAVEREIEDIEALVNKAGGKAYLYGSSSGAALALLAASKLGPDKIIKLALYEPPYASDNTLEFAEEKEKVNELVAAGKPDDAITFFLGRRGMSPEVLEDMKKSPEWEGLKNMGHTLVYDFEVLGDGNIPVTIAKSITVPTQIIDGEKSFDFIHATADNLGQIISGAMRKTLKGQTHQASPEILVSVLKEFFKK